MDSCGDARMTYYILTEWDDRNQHQKVLMQSIIQTCRKHIGTLDEYVNDDPNDITVTLTFSEHNKTLKDIKSTEEMPLLFPGEKIVTASKLSISNPHRA